MPVAEVFKALGDPVRLQMLNRVVEQPMLTLSSLTKDLAMSRQGARKHVQVLADARLISVIPRGRETIVQLNEAEFATAMGFIHQLEQAWDTRLAALKRYVENDLEI